MLIDDCQWNVSQFRYFDFDISTFDFRLSTFDFDFDFRLSTFDFRLWFRLKLQYTLVTSHSTLFFILVFLFRKLSRKALDWVWMGGGYGCDDINEDNVVWLKYCRLYSRLYWILFTAHTVYSNAILWSSIACVS
jgi:hypothetical protein